MVSDKQQYYWQLHCKKHVQLCTTEAAARQFAANGCLGCDRCDVALHPARRSQFEKYTWEQLQQVLGQSDVQQSMASLMPDLQGIDMGYVVEAKVLRGKLGAADVYIPALDMIIQVDGQHHDKLEQLVKDARFDAMAHEQKRALLRLHYDDMPAFHKIIPHAMMLCIKRCELATRSSLIMYSWTHPQQERPNSSVSIDIRCHQYPRTMMP